VSGQEERRGRREGATSSSRRPGTAPPSIWELHLTSSDQCWKRPTRARALMNQDSGTAISLVSAVRNVPMSLGRRQPRALGRLARKSGMGCTSEKKSENRSYRTPRCRRADRNWPSWCN
jgi:hypothetical protein